MVLGIIVAQRLLPNAVATASAIFMNSDGIQQRTGRHRRRRWRLQCFGLPAGLFIPAACSLAAVIGLAAMANATKPEQQ